MSDLIIAVGIALVLEGIFYAAFPEAVRRHMKTILEAPPSYLRKMGLIAIFLGLGIVWLIKG